MKSNKKSLAPPVYRPQSPAQVMASKPAPQKLAPKVAQAKQVVKTQPGKTLLPGNARITVANSASSRSASVQPKLVKQPPAAPAVYRPLSAPKVLQTKLRTANVPITQRPGPQRSNNVVQNSMRTTPPAGPRGIIQRAEAAAPAAPAASFLDDSSVYTSIRMGVGGKPAVVKSRTTTYYRKMSKAEFAACYDGRNYNFAGFFKWATGGHHRLWLTTSLTKARGFSNEDYSSSSDIVVLFEFNSDLLASFKAKAHQEKGVQHDMNVVAIHREGFRDGGNMQSDEDVARVLGQGKGFSLGFGSSHAAILSKLLSYIKVLARDGWAEAPDDIAGVAK